MEHPDSSDTKQQDAIAAQKELIDYTFKKSRQTMTRVLLIAFPLMFVFFLIIRFVLVPLMVSR